MVVSETRGPQYSTLNSRILIIRTPKLGTPNFRKLPRVQVKKVPKASEHLMKGARPEVWIWPAPAKAPAKVCLPEKAS